MLMALQAGLPPLDFSEFEGERKEGVFCGSTKRVGQRLPAHGEILQRGDFTDSAGLREEVTVTLEVMVTFSFATRTPSIAEDEDTVDQSPLSRITGSSR